MALLGRLRRAVKKLTFLLNLKKYLSLQWRFVSSFRTQAPITILWRQQTPPALGLNDRPGLIAFADLGASDHHNGYEGDDEKSRSEGSSGTTSPYRLLGSTSFTLEDQDVDEKADELIAEFYRKIILDRQISLELRYCRANSYSSSTDDQIKEQVSAFFYQDTPISPSSSFGSQLVSPT